MIITTRLVTDIETGAVLEHEWYEYDGPVAECKVSDAQKKAADSNQAFTEQLRNQFNQRFGESSATTKFLTDKMQGMMADPYHGYSTAEETALRGNATETNAKAFGDAQQSLNRTTQQMSGGGTIPSGAALQLQQQLAANGAASNATAQRDITINNAQQGLSNYFNAGNTLTTLAGQQGNQAQGLATSAVQNAPNSYNEVTAAHQPGFWENLGMGLVGAGTQAGLSFLTGGASNIIQGAGQMASNASQSQGQGFSNMLDVNV